MKTFHSAALVKSVNTKKARACQYKIIDLTLYFIPDVSHRLSNQFCLFQINLFHDWQLTFFPFSSGLWFSYERQLCLLIQTMLRDYPLLLCFIKSLQPFQSGLAASWLCTGFVCRCAAVANPCKPRMLRFRFGVPSRRGSAHETLNHISAKMYKNAKIIFFK